MNVQMQMGGVCILLLLLYFYKRQGTLGLYLGRIFLRTVYLTLLCLILDILSVVLIVAQDAVPLWLVEAECKTYLVSLVATGYMALIYANADIRHLARADGFARKLMLLLAGFAALIYVLPIHIFYDGVSAVYTYGLSCYAAYLSALSLVLITLGKLILQGKAMNPKRRSAIILWMFIWMCAAALQFMNNKLLLVGFSGALSVMILFFELENPEIFIDRNTGFYNRYAMVEYLGQRYRLGRLICGIWVSLEDILEREVPYFKLDAVMTELGRFVRQLPGAMVFKTDVRELALIFESREAYEKAKEAMFDRFERSWLEEVGGDAAGGPVYLQPHYLLLPSGAVAKSVDELLSILKYFHLHPADGQEGRVLVLDEETVSRKRERDEMLEEVVQAMKEDRVEVFFQPIYSTAQKKFVAAEALARIRRTDGSIIPPGLFIPIAEETGLITKIGETVFEKTCRFIKENDIAGYGVEYIEVNLSVVQCENEALAETYIGIMKRHDLSPQYVNLEITESAAIVKKNVLLENMRLLIDYGVAFSLDDFGNGQSNLNYIVDMPVQIVKFDRDMTQAYFQTPKAQFVLQAATNMVHEMQLKVVSEGVETAEQLAVLEALGIDYVQGYYFSKPVDAKTFLAFVRKRNQAG